MTKRTKKSKPAPAATPETPPKPSAGAQVIEYENPPPEYLLEEAMKEEDRKLVEDYIQSIRVLRDQKRFTFREIADWLKEYGVIVDHNAIYRAYIRHMSNRDAAHVAEANAHEEDERHAE